MLNVITSFTKEGFNQYGRKCLETFKHYWPSNVKLTIYHEGEIETPLKKHFNWVPIEEVEHLGSFLNNLHFPLMRGGDPYDINWDARMARKSFMQMHSCQKYGGKVFWLDGDTITHAQVPETFLDECLPFDKLNCFLGRDGWYYTESGFIGFNAEHPLFRKFYELYLGIFVTGSIFKLKGWHDCYGFDAARKAMNADDAFVNLAKDVPIGTMHPFINTVCGTYMDHRKGNRKDSRTPATELVLGREEPYWS